MLKLKQRFHFKVTTHFTESDKRGQNISELSCIFWNFPPFNFNVAPGGRSVQTETTFYSTRSKKGEKGLLLKKNQNIFQNHQNFQKFQILRPSINELWITTLNCHSLPFWTDKTKNTLFWVTFHCQLKTRNWSLWRALLKRSFFLTQTVFDLDNVKALRW